MFERDRRGSAASRWAAHLCGCLPRWVRGHGLASRAVTVWHAASRSAIASTKAGTTDLGAAPFAKLSELHSRDLATGRRPARRCHPRPRTTDSSVALSGRCDAALYVACWGSRRARALLAAAVWGSGRRLHSPFAMLAGDPYPARSERESAPFPCWSAQFCPPGRRQWGCRRADPKVWCHLSAQKMQRAQDRRHRALDARRGSILDSHTRLLDTMASGPVSGQTRSRCSAGRSPCGCPPSTGCGSLPVCGPVERRAEAWLQRGLPSS